MIKAILTLALFVCLPLGAAEARYSYPWTFFTYVGSVGGKSVKVISEVFHTSERARCSSFKKFVRAEFPRIDTTGSKCYVWREETEQAARDSRYDKMNQARQYKMRIKKVCFRRCLN